MSVLTISNILSREVLDSRGNPTVEVDIVLSDGSMGRAIVPSGASTGEHEAVELRDGDKSRFLGRGVLNAVNNIQNIIRPVLLGKQVNNQQEVDILMKDLDGTENKSNLGANAILAVSMAYARASAAGENKPLFQYLGGDEAVTLPIPMMNILNGGSHADNNVDIQEFMVFPVGAKTFFEALQMGTEIFHQLKAVLKAKNLNTAVGDEGGFAPNLSSNEEAIEMIISAVENAGYTMGTEIFLALDVAASELFHDGRYLLDSHYLTTAEMVDYYSGLIQKYQIVSIEDGLDENDWEGWKMMNELLGKTIQIVGDDLTVTNLPRLQKAIDEKAMNSILIKLNQIGTVSETVDAISLAKQHGYGAIISHRSGETEDTTIADFAVAMGMGQIKTGSASRTDRICKYNQLLRIEKELGSRAIFPGMNVLGKS